MKGRVVSVNISGGGIPKMPVDTVEVLATHLQGDGRNHEKHNREWRAVSLLDVEQLGRFQQLGFGVRPGSMGENLTIEGIDCRELMPGDIVDFENGVRLEITEPRIPCYVLDGIHPTLKEHSWGTCGTMARIVSGGTIMAGETFQFVANRFTESESCWEHTGVIFDRTGSAGSDIDGLKGVLGEVVIRVVVADQSLNISALREIDSQILFVTIDQNEVSPYLLRVLIDRYVDGLLMFRTEAGRKITPSPAILPSTLLGSFLECIHAADSKESLLKTLKPSWVTISNRLADFAHDDRAEEKAAISSL